MPITQPAGAVRTLVGANALDFVFSRNGALLYVVQGSSIVEYDVRTGNVVRSFAVGQAPGGMDLSADGRTLLIADKATFNGNEGRAYALDLATGTVTTFPLANDNYGSLFDIAWLSNGHALVSENTRFSTSLLRELHVQTGSYGPVVATVGPNAVLTASGDDGRVLVQPLAYQRPLYLYTAGQGVTSSIVQIADPFAGASVPDASPLGQALSPTGDLVVIGLNVLNSSLQLQVALGVRYPELLGARGLAFSEDGSRLFVLTSDRVFALATSDWSVVAGYTVGIAYAANFGNSVQIAPGGFLAVNIDGAVKVVDLNLAVSDVGTPGADTVSDSGRVYTFDGNDNLSANGGSANLYAGGGDDVLTGSRTVATFMYGGSGDDTYYVVDPGNQVIENPNSGNDTIYSEVNYRLPINVERLVLTGTAFQAIGNADANLIEGNAAANLIGGDAGDDVLIGGDGNDTLDGGVGADTLYGDGGDDMLNVSGATAGSGLDRVFGGAGIDRLVADYSAMTVAVRAAPPLFSFERDWGVDLFAGVTEVPLLTARQIEAQTVTTGSGDDMLWLFSTADLIATGTGSDYIRNYTWNGNNQYAARVVGRVRIDAGPGVDAAEVDWSDLATAVVFDTGNGAGVSIGSGEFERYLRGVEVLTYFRSGSGDDRITLNGGQGLTQIPGGGVPYQTVSTGAGNDILTVRGRATSNGIGFFQLDLGDGADDQLVIDMSLASERLTASGGTASLNGSLFLSAQGMERVTLRGGTAGDELEGLSGNDLLQGGGGADVLIVSAGSDVLEGGAGNDTLRIDAAASGAGYGVALDASRFSFTGTDSLDGTVRIGTFDTRFTGIERFEIVGSSFADRIVTGGGDDRLEGGWGDDRLEGGAGADWLDGGMDADTLIGGAGDDTYVVDALDMVVEAAGGGVDTVRTSISGYALPANVERLIYTGSGGTLSGTARNDDLTGGSGNDFFNLTDGGDDVGAGGTGNDSFYFGAALTAADRIDGGAGADVMAIQGNYPALTLGADSLVGVETLTVLPGSDNRFGDNAGNRYAYAIATIDATITAGTQLKINGANLEAGESLSVNAAAERDGSVFIYGGKGVDTFVGGSGADAFFMAEDRLTAGDRFDGGAGADVLVIRGSYAATLAADTFTNIETITLMSAADSRFYSGGTSFSYDIVASEGTVAAGALMTINGGRLGATEVMRWNGAAETNGTYRLFGGSAGDTLGGGRGNDLIYGGLGADVLAGGGGNDVFRYDAAGESGPSARDAITDFALGDVIDLGRVDAHAGLAGDQAFSFLGGAAFSGQAGQLRATASGNSWLIEADIDGDGAADLSLLVNVTDGHALTAANFVL